MKQLGLKLASMAAPAVILAECALLLSTGFAKLDDIGAFSEILGSHGLVPEAWTQQVAGLVAFGEVAVAAGTLIALVRRPASMVPAILPAVLFGAFGTYAFVLVVSPPPSPSACGCGLSSTAAKHGADWAWIAARDFGIAGVTVFFGAALARLRAGEDAATLPDGPPIPIGAE